MPRDPALRLHDILEACDLIEGYLAGYDLERFQADRRTSDAVVRQFEIIGEAVKGLPDALRQKESRVPLSSFHAKTQRGKEEKEKPWRS